jgi:hypothetical protein
MHAMLHGGQTADSSAGSEVTNSGCDDLVLLTKQSVAACISAIRQEEVNFSNDNWIFSEAALGLIRTKSIESLKGRCEDTTALCIYLLDIYNP